MPSLKLYWRKPVIQAVTAFRIVKHLDVVESFPHGVVPDCVGLALDAPAFEKLQEAFSDSVVGTVSMSAHAWRQLMRHQEIAPLLAGELDGLNRSCEP